MPNQDLEQAIQHALEPLTQIGAMELCAQCGSIRHDLEDHRCESGLTALPGVEPDEKRRAKSYVIE